MLPRSERGAIGGFANLLNSGISFARGDIVDGVLNLFAALPGLGAAGDAVTNSRAFARLAHTLGRFKGVFGAFGTAMNTISNINKAIHCQSASRVFRTLGKVLGRCFVGDTLVLIGFEEPGGTEIIVDAGITTTAGFAGFGDEHDSTWMPLVWIAIGVAGVVVMKDDRRTFVLLRRKLMPVVVPPVGPPDDPLPPPLQADQIDSACDQLFAGSASESTRSQALLGNARSGGSASSFSGEELNFTPPNDPCQISDEVQQIKALLAAKSTATSLESKSDPSAQPAPPTKAKSMLSWNWKAMLWGGFCLLMALGVWGQGR